MIQTFLSFQVQIMFTHVLEMGIVLHQSCKTWLLSGMYRGFLNDGLLFYIEVYHFYKNDKQCLSISLTLRKTPSHPEFQYILHDPKNKEITLLIILLTADYCQFLRNYVHSFHIVSYGYIYYEFHMTLK
jgi:hypothetical protein